MINRILTATACAFLVAPACASSAPRNPEVDQEPGASQPEEPDRSDERDLDGDGKPDAAPPDPNDPNDPKNPEPKPDPKPQRATR